MVYLFLHRSKLNPNNNNKNNSHIIIILYINQISAAMIKLCKQKRLALEQAYLDLQFADHDKRKLKQELKTRTQRQGLKQKP